MSYLLRYSEHFPHKTKGLIEYNISVLLREEWPDLDTRQIKGGPKTIITLYI